ncbi:hypothetical protein B9K06_18085 [Bacillus sp. OG2]|nr:hypothetical protein B9K06_18085 [Bacillus sp. OG2]
MIGVFLSASPGIGKSTQPGLAGCFFDAELRMKISFYYKALLKFVVDVLIKWQYKQVSLILI